MDCPHCHYDTRVVESTKDDRKQRVYRRRECIKCGQRFTTFERRDAAEQTANSNSKKS